MDTHSGHDNVTNNSRFTVPTGWAGYYSVSGLVYFASGTTGVRCAALAKNGTQISGTLTRDQSTADTFGNGIPTPTLVLQLAVADYIEVQGLHTEGTSINTYIGPPETSSLSVAFLRA